MLRPISLSALMFLGLIADRAEAQVVQLPTFEMFGFSTTVNVPIGGSANLGGIGRASRSRFGGGRPFGVRGIASGPSAGGSRVTVTVHDFERMDQMLLAEAAARRGSHESVRRTVAQQQLGSVARGSVSGGPVSGGPVSGGPVSEVSSAQRPALGLAEIRSQRAADARAKESEAHRLIARAATAQAQGKYALAKMFYRMASKKTDDDSLRRRIADLLAVVASSRGQGRIAQRR